MTTRPELLPACVALFAHPDDKEKYQNKIAITPLGIEVPILFDESVEKNQKITVSAGVKGCQLLVSKDDIINYTKATVKKIIRDK